MCGEASVRYMAGTPHSDKSAVEGVETAADESDGPTEAVIPERIHAAVPEAKLIAVLRDPVERLVSEYKMALLRDEEERPLTAVVDDALAPERLAEARAFFSTKNSYVAQSEYGRILAPFYERFGAERILVLFTDDLADSTGDVVARVCRFLGVDDSFTPSNLGVRYLPGATEKRFRFLDVPAFLRFVRRAAIVRRTWQRLPIALRRRVWRFNFSIEKWNRSAEKDEGPTLDPESERRLREHFGADRARLTALIGVEPPWR